MTEYGITKERQEHLDNIFTHHPPKSHQAERYPLIRNSGKHMAELICRLAPPSREREIALTKLEECIMWANASIARNE